MGAVVQVGTLTGSGSGVIIDAKKGLILTVAHNVVDEKLIYIPIFDKNIEAQILYLNKELDLALLKVHVQLSQEINPLLSDNSYKEGESVWVIGFPRGQIKVGTHGFIKDLGSPIGVIAKTTIEQGYSGGVAVSCINGIFVFKGVARGQLEAIYKDGHTTLLPNTTLFVRNDDVHTFLASTGIIN